MDRQVFVEAGKHGFTGMAIAEEFGGGGVDDFRFNAVINEELATHGGGLVRKLDAMLGDQPPSGR